MENNIINFEKEYEGVHYDYSQFTQKVAVLCREMLKAKKIDFHLLESRTKEVKSFLDKINRPGKSYLYPISEITDISGIRIITYYQDAANEVAKLIEKEFLVDRDNSVFHTASAAEFGYKSAHFVVKISPERADLIEWQGFSKFTAEIQVRTVLQHAWAAISHKLQYKREEDVPTALKRKLFRLSALFELADDEFVSLRDASGQITKEISDSVTRGERHLAIDYVSLGQLIDTSPVITKICNYAAGVGFNFDCDYNESDEENRDSLSDLIQISVIAGISTIEEFENKIESTLPWVNDYLFEQYNYDEGDWQVTPQFICELVIIGACIEKIRLDDLFFVGFHNSIGERVYRVAASFDKNLKK
ncbi:GTP pyrophosphokinase [Vogesella indigofera]|uniref:GTP pyrophosphokinase n=1 Tax=Vogesella indigofera TaxID=45465 RepID=UPI00234F9CD5|nr:hypothetical protein [Vogesella indigofera]MDC7709291.1 hypothetical protein [Vogesella indigofera]